MKTRQSLGLFYTGVTQEIAYSVFHFDWSAAEWRNLDLKLEISSIVEMEERNTLVWKTTHH
ncbi:hypothetical protein ACLI09_00145 [Flavobacterium sp. RHBU_24]|uniref:hypothetical protein n=1 Tax=Flavobacterium sp. RHBU_24 TaxID=3391185 RepID=UPI0039848608